ncbi:SKP1-like protein 1B [Capsicum baccatum]|uniref:SKP1-like protein n=1 Tax=Capsicum baccatum TaxID=33114 RepID=A0A2G2XEU8_CAPBA|nr:SKP1-like protein 1B [Capsicum baccatum]
MSSTKLLTLKTSDGEKFVVNEALAVRSQAIKNMVEDGCTSNVIPLPNVHSKTMSKIIKYWKKHSEEEGVSKEQLKDSDKDFLQVHPSVLYDLISAANYLNDKELLDITCQEAADRIKSKIPEEIHKEFDIKSDFTLEEEEEIRNEHPWAFH